MFVHLHNHTEYSLLDGASRIEELVGTAVGQGMPAVAITDHGNMHGAIEFYLAAQKVGIKPIIGLEAYVAPGSRFDKKHQDRKETANHLVLIAKNLAGYKNLLRLCTKSHLEGFYYKPRIDNKLLEEHHDGLIALTACLKGRIPSLVLDGRTSEAEEMVHYYKGVFGEGNFYLEIQNHGIENELKFLKAVPDIAKKCSVPLVATNDIHYVKKEDAFAHEVLVCLGTGKTLADEKRMKFSGVPLHFRTEEEMRELFSEFPDALDNTVKIAERCDLELRFEDKHYPVFRTDDGTPLKDFLGKLAEEGIEKRYGTKEILPEVRERFNHELEVIDERNLIGYILIVWDFIHYAKSKGIPVGPGRGSAVGSLICYLVGICDIDPLKYGLFFERFTSRERPTFPDIDVDICRDRRSEVIDYVREKYGNDRVAQIITFGTLGAKMVVRDVGRVLGYSYGDCDRIAKLIPGGPKITLRNVLDSKEADLKKAYETEPMVKEIIDIGFRLEGLSRNASTHAAGVVICEDELTDHVPLCRNGDDIVTQFSMDIVDKVGLLKMDFLGLKNLTIIDHAAKIIKKRRGIDLDMSRIPVDDRKTLDLLNSAETSGLFQLESSGMTGLAKRMKIDRFEDIMAMIALFRPGPMAMIDDFIKRKQNQKKIKYDHPLLEPVLKETYGIFVYQEQVMQAAVVLAGYSLGESDVLRDTMGKKKKAKMAAQRARFLDGAEKNKISRKTAEKIFDRMEKFAEYGFNKSHSAAYSFIVYQTAYLKANYPVEYMAALLSNEMGSTDQIAKYTRECERMGINVLPPDVNESEDKFTVVENRIRFGLAAIKNVGHAAIEHMVRQRKSHGSYRTFYEFASDMDSKLINRKVFESLAKCGAFDTMGYTRSQILKALDDKILDMAAKQQEDKKKGQGSLFDAIADDDSSASFEPKLPSVAEFPVKKLLSFEKELLGFYITGHPLNDYRDKISAANCVPFEELNTLPDRSKVRVAALVQKVRTTVKKKTGEKMAILMVEDTETSMEALVFPEAYSKCREKIIADEALIIVGSVNKRDDNPKIVVDDMFLLDELDSSAIEKINKPFNGKRIIEQNGHPKKFAYRNSPSPPATPQRNHSLTIYLDSSVVEDDQLVDLNGLLKNYPGPKPVVLIFSSEGKQVRLQIKLMVSDDDGLKEALQKKNYVMKCS